MSAVGNSDLDPDAQAVYLEKFGLRYVGVQWQPGTANRKERRQRRFRPAMNADVLARLELEGKAINTRRRR